MFPSQIRMSQLIAEYKELEAYCDVLKGALVDLGLPVPERVQGLLAPLSRQQRELIGMLFRSYPEPRDRYDLIELLSGWADDRSPRQIDVTVHGIRKQLGQEFIRTERGQGFALGEDAHRQLRAEKSRQAGK